MSQDTGQTAKENYWQIVSWYDMPYGKVDKGMWIGQARNPADRIYWENPEPPTDPAKIIGWNIPKEDQIWTREELPAYWEDSYLRDMAVAKFSTGSTDAIRIKNADYNWYKNVRNLTDEQYEYQDREWDRRLDGVWVMINGTPTYLTGKYYCYLQWWWLADTYPEFRDRDLIVFYAWQAMCDHPLCKGGIFPKHRRAGDTSKWAYEGVEETTKTKGGHFGIQAAGDDGAKKVFTDKVLPGFKRWPPFFKPITSSGDNPKAEIVMDNESRRGRSQYSQAKHEALEGWIKYAANGGLGVAPFDGDKLIRFFRDEGGKADKTDILDNWELVAPTLSSRTQMGKAAWPSSVEDVEGKHKGKFQMLYLDSMPSLMETSGTGATRSGLWSMFIPCYCGHEKYWFVGKYGESVVHTPTPEQREWLLANRATTEKERKVLSDIYDQGGAYEYEMRERTAKNNAASHRRKYPFTIDDVFAINNPRCHFNIEKLSHLKDQLTSMAIENGKVISLRDKLTVRGYLRWKTGMISDVYFAEDPNGPFEFNKAYMSGGEIANRLGIQANKYNRDSAGVYPSTNCVIRIGFDPQKSDAEDTTGHKSGLSKAGGHAFYPFDPSIDHDVWDEEDPNFAENYITHAWIFQYYNLPSTSFSAAEDMLKACIFLNAKFHSEAQVATAIQFFKNVGAGRYLLYDYRLNGINRASKKVTAGQASTVFTHQKGDGCIGDFVQFHCYPNRMPFVDTIDQWIKYDGSNNNVLDLKVASEMTLMAVQPGALLDHKANAAKAVKEEVKALPKDKWVGGFVKLSKGLRM